LEYGEISFAFFQQPEDIYPAQQAVGLLRFSRRAEQSTVSARSK